MLLCAATYLVTPEALADLDADLSRLTSAWSRRAKVTRLEPRLQHKNEVSHIAVARALLDISRNDCVTVAVLGARSSQFVLRFSPAEGGPTWPDSETPEQSAAGAAQLVRCGVRKALLERLVIEMRSPRGVLEVVIAHGDRPAPALSRILPVRDPGPDAPFGRVGPTPTAAPVATRQAARMHRLRRDGAAEVLQGTARSLRDGSSEVRVRLQPGCHELTVLSPDPVQEREPRDLDAELVTLPNGTSLASDRTVAIDAVLSTCVGEVTPAQMRVVGAEPLSVVTVVHGIWQLSDALPERWGADARARVAEVLGPSLRRSLKTPPVYQSLGASGVTLLPLSLTPGRCYVLAAAVLRGRAVGISLASDLGSRQVQNHSGSDGTGAALSFCAYSTSALIEVEARGSGLFWLGSLWSVGSVELGAVP